MRALIIERKLTRFAAARLASTFGTGRGAGLGPLRLTDREAPRDPGANWYGVTPLLSGICGSDLATVDGRSSQYFEHLVSFPFIPGHEVVAVMDEDGIDAHGRPLTKGTRVVIQPVLGCAARGLPLCPACEAGDVGRCQHLTAGHIRAGLQTGYCADTGGGWCEGPMQAHASQLYEVPEHLSDDDAVMVEPMACAIHAALRGSYDEESVVAVVGAGTLGLGVIAALNFLDSTNRRRRPRRIVVGARYLAQQRIARLLGANDVVPGDQLIRAVRTATHSMVVGRPNGSTPQLAGGADVVYDCVGSASSLAESLQLVAPGGQIVMVGMPGKASVDLAPLWQREVELVGAYAYGTERFGEESTTSFDLAIEMAGAMELGRLVTARYPIERFEEAIAHAGMAGPRGAVKIVFEPGRKKAGTQEGGPR
jgi:threonine dehydrogenase-like Zn-dependent dehydrogenase